jgi:tRNA (guanine37-N1)-methyltransferase
MTGLTAAPGMVMKVEPLRDAIRAAKADAPGSKVVYLSPQGRVLTQRAVSKLGSGGQGLILIAGRYEGVDERLIESEVDEEWSIGDYVLSGGELPAMILIDAITRLIPGALGHEDSAQQDSHVDGLLDCPHYTRPEEIDGMPIPNVLRSGNHELIRRWRLQQSLGRTWKRRPDLLEKRQLSAEETELLKTFIAAQKQQTNEEQ